MSDLALYGLIAAFLIGSIVLLFLYLVERLKMFLKKRLGKNGKLGFLGGFL